MKTSGATARNRAFPIEMGTGAGRLKVLLLILIALAIVVMLYRPPPRVETSSDSYRMGYSTGRTLGPNFNCSSNVEIARAKSPQQWRLGCQAGEVGT